MSEDITEEQESPSLNVFSEEAIDELSQGFLHTLQPEVLRVEQSLNELT